MIIIRQQGRLGNQLFQYGLYRSLEEMGKLVFLDCEHPINLSEKNQLDLFPKVNYRKADREESEKIGNCKRNLYNRIYRKLKCPPKKSHYMEKEGDDLSVLVQLEDRYLDGFWQSEKYFLGIRDRLLQELEFPKLEDKKNLEWIERMREINSVSIHVRRGDYVSPKYIKNYGGICTAEYYQRAIQYIERKVLDPYFFIFTDEPEWIEQNFELPENMLCIANNKERNSYIDMQLMSNCKHNIIANSSFSWWGAWLNQNEDKIVVMPSKWQNSRENRDIVCQGWICIDGCG